MFEELKDYNTIDWAKLLFIILLVVGLGLFSINQFAKFRYNTALITQPCDLCLELNPQLDLQVKINLSTTNGLTSNFNLPTVP